MSVRSGQLSPLSVGVIGAGRVGAVLAAVLAGSGHRIVAASGDSPGSRRRIAALLPGTAHAAPAEVAAAATGLLLVAVPDDRLADTVAELPGTGARVVAHTSGAHGLAVLGPLAAAGTRPLAVHPAMTFTGEPADLDRVRAGIAYGVTAPAELRQFASGLVADLGGTPEWISEAARPLYHAALAHGANHLVTLVNEALDRLRDAGVRDPAALISPLLHAALDNTLRTGDRALTGPVARGDAATVAAHLASLAAAEPGSVPAYRVLAGRTAERARAAGLLTTEAATALAELLNGAR